MKQRINVVVVENEKLQTELRSKAADESLGDYTLKSSMVTPGLRLGPNPPAIVSARWQQCKTHTQEERVCGALSGSFTG